MAENIQEIVALALSYNKKVNQLLLYLQGYHDITDTNVHTAGGTDYKRNLDNLIANVAEVAEEDNLPQKLAYGKGTICKRTRITKNGVYVYYQGRYIDSLGKRRTVTAKSYTACLNLIKQYMPKTKQRIKIKINTMRECLTQFITLYKDGQVTEHTIKGYYSLINNLPLGFLESPIQNIKQKDLQTIINDVSKQYTNTAQKLYNLFRQVFRQANINEFIPKDIGLGLVKPKHRGNEEVPLTNEQQQLLIKAATGITKYVIIGYLWTGCRVQELLDLKWEYYNAETKSLRIAGTKTITSDRVIPVFEPLIKLLEEIPKQSEYIFDISLKQLKRNKAKLEKSTGINFTLKSLRHTFNQNMFELGVKDIVRASWLGHSKPTTTKKVYTHLTDALTLEAICLINEKYTT